MTTLKEKRSLSGFALKRIAVISMLIDHFGSIVMDGVIAPYTNNGAIFFTEDMPFMVRNAFVIKNICEILGSIAFPIFCFLVVQGFLHTKNALSYGMRMGLFALVSEIPYNLAHYQTVFEPKLQNVMFTLCIGIFTLFFVKKAEQHFSSRKTVRWIVIAAAVIAGMAVAFAVRSEYVFLGVLTIALLYIFRNCGVWRVLGICPLMIASPWVLVAAIPLLFYNGNRGKGSKYFFYVFYPMHFLFFAGIAYLLAQR